MVNCVMCGTEICDKPECKIFECDYIGVNGFKDKRKQKCFNIMVDKTVYQRLALCETCSKEYNEGDTPFKDLPKNIQDAILVEAL